MHKTYKALVFVPVMFLLSLASDYSWDPKLKEQALDSYLFLAPSGLLKNLGHESPYSEAYTLISGRFREGFFDKPLLVLLEIILLGLCFYALLQWRKKA